MSLRFDNVVCTASLRPSLTMSQRSSVKTGPPDSNRCLDEEKEKRKRLFGDFGFEELRISSTNHKWQ